MCAVKFKNDSEKYKSHACYTQVYLNIAGHLCHAVTCEQQWRRPVSAFAQSGQRHCNSLSGIYVIQAFYMYMPRNSSVLASLGSLESWIASYLVENYEDSFLCHGKITCSL